MGNLGIGEIALIIIVIYFLFGPEKLPKVLGGMGKSIGEFLKIKDEVSGPLKEVENTVKQTISEVKSPLADAVTKIKMQEQTVTKNTESKNIN